MIAAHNSNPVLIACAVGGYLIGSVPFGMILTRQAGLGDVRQIGSGNIGATNVLRTGRRDLALATLVADALKGALPVVVAGWFVSPLGAAIAGGAAFLGHLFPVWLGFRGGKGVATFFGVILAIAWPAGLAAGATWIVTALLFRWSSLASIVSAALAPVLVGLFKGWGIPAFWLAVFMAVFIWIRHRGNIERLIEGKEPKIDAERKAV